MEPSRIFGAALGQNIPRIAASPTTLAIILNTIYSLAGALAVIFIIVGGIRYITSAGNPASVTQAKNTILYAVMGLVVALLAFAITNFVIGQVNVTSFDQLRDSIINTLILLAGALSVIFIVYGAFLYVASGGNLGDGKTPGKVQTAKNTILFAVIGLVISILAFAIINFVIKAI